LLSAAASSPAPTTLEPDAAIAGDTFARNEASRSDLVELAGSATAGGEEKAWAAGMWGCVTCGGKGAAVPLEALTGCGTAAACKCSCVGTSSACSKPMLTPDASSMCKLDGETRGAIASALEAAAEGDG